MAVVEFDADAVRLMLLELPIELRDKAIGAAINKTADKAKTEMKRQIVEHYNLKSTEVGSSLHVVGAKWREANKMSASMYPTTLGGRGRAMNVVHFLQGTSTGELLFLFLRNGGNKIIGAGPAGQSKPFVGNSGRTVFRRTGKGRLPIEPVQVVDVPQMFNTKKLNEAVLEKASADLLVEAERAVNYLIEKYK
jgi:hypothetical protein